jgi:hypothetical protein
MVRSLELKSGVRKDRGLKPAGPAAGFVNLGEVFRDDASRVPGRAGKL